MFVIDENGRLDVDDLPEELQSEDRKRVIRNQESLIGRPIEEVEAYYIEQALRLANGNREEAARLEHRRAARFYRKIKDYDIATTKTGRRGKSDPLEAAQPVSVRVGLI